MGSHYRFTQSNMRTSTALFFTFLFLFLSLQVTAKKGKGTIGKILDHVKDIKQSIAASDLSLTLELFDDDLLHCNFIITFDGGADQRGCGRLETLVSERFVKLLQQHPNNFVSFSFSVHLVFSLQCRKSLESLDASA